MLRKPILIWSMRELLERTMNVGNPSAWVTSLISRYDNRIIRIEKTINPLQRNNSIEIYKK